jgi:hypothetical protein
MTETPKARVYFAARYSRNAEMRTYAQDLTETGRFDVQAEWITGKHDDTTDEECARIDYAEVAAADVVISFTEAPGPVHGRGRGGRHVEFGIALALGKHCVVVGSRENVFHHLPQVAFFETWARALPQLIAWERDRSKVRKIIFLDIDGVLCTAKTCAESKQRWMARKKADEIIIAGDELSRIGDDSLDSRAVAELDRICAATGAEIVVSSSWRISHGYEGVRRVLEHYGFKHGDRVIGQTPNLNGHRGTEIARWVDENAAGDARVCVIDDDDQVEPFVGRNVWIARGFERDGMTERYADKAIRMLNAAEATP